MGAIDKATSDQATQSLRDDELDAVTAAGSFDGFPKLGDIAGESTDKDHKGELAGRLRIA